LKTLSLLVFLVSFISTAFGASDYYPKNFKYKLENLSNEQLKEEIFKVLDMKHVKTDDGDVLVSHCGQAQGHCYSQQVLGYTSARKLLFGKIHLERDEQNRYYVRDVYCHENFTQGVGVGPDRIPNHNILNCEHTWPQSKFNSRFPNEMQKSDLHHLYPTDSKANNIRGNFEFGEVENENHSLCGNSQFGAETGSGRGQYFEPPVEHKGNVARSLFYFSIRYKMPISQRQEETLRQWHIADPVDQEERDRNEQIFLHQKNRNPFIDMPELVDQIADF
jgi:deoxyribonuclease I